MLPKNRKAGLDRPLKVGGGIQPLLVTVLTPATTCAVGLNFSQNNCVVNRRKWLFVFLIQLFLEIDHYFVGEVVTGSTETQ